MTGSVAAYTNSSICSHPRSREILEAPACWTQISFAIAHGKSWNRCSLEIVPDRGHKRDWDSHAGIKLPTFSDKILDTGSSLWRWEEKSAQLVLSGNVKLTTDKRSSCVQKKSHYTGLYWSETWRISDEVAWRCCFAGYMHPTTFSKSPVFANRRRNSELSD